MPTSFSVEYQGRRVKVVADPIWERDRVRLLVDGEPVAETKANGKRTVLAGEGFEVRAVTPFWGGDVLSASLVPEGEAEVELELEPEPGTRAARRLAFARRHPKLYASRHVASGTAQVAAAIIGFTFLLRLLPSISLDLPDLPLPTIDLPDLPLPSWQVDLTPPAWVQALLESKPYWVPIVVGVVLAVREVKRRKRMRRG